MRWNFSPPAARSSRSSFWVPARRPPRSTRCLTVASRVPDHGKLAPWRFIVFEGEARRAAGEAIVAAFRAKYPDAKPEQVEAERERLTRAPLVIAVVSRAAPHVKIPEWEQVLSAGAAGMNLVLAAHALGYGANWITEWYAYDRSRARRARARAARAHRRLRPHRPAAGPARGSAAAVARHDRDPLSGRAGLSRQRPLSRLPGRAALIGFDCVAQGCRQRHRLACLERHHCGDHAGAQPLEPSRWQTMATPSEERPTRSTSSVRSMTSPIRLGILKSHSMWTNGKPLAVAHDQLGIIVAELLRVPVLDQAVEHVEIVREVDDAGRVAMRKADRHAAGEGAGGRRKSAFEHLLSCSDSPRRRHRQRRHARWPLCIELAYAVMRQGLRPVADFAKARSGLSPQDLFATPKASQRCPIPSHSIPRQSTSARSIACSSARWCRGRSAGPRPSTRDGVANLAPFSFFTVVCVVPPMISLTIRAKADGSEKHTLKNVRATGEFCFNVVTRPVWTADGGLRQRFPEDDSEFAETGLTPIPSVKVKPPRVKEVPIHFECKLHQVLELGPQAPTRW